MMILPIKEKAFIFYSDPGHGWLRVRRETLLALGELALKISIGSYERGEFVYLEEDRDLTLFLTAYRATGTRHSISEVQVADSSRIRNYAGFKLTEAEEQQLANVRMPPSQPFSTLSDSGLGAIR